MKNNFDIKPTNWGLIARLLFNLEDKEIASEPGEIESLSASEKIEMEKSRKLSKKIDLFFLQNKYSETKAWESVRQKTTNSKKRTLPLQLFLRVAAIVVFAVVMGVLSYSYFKPENAVTQIQLVADNQPISTFELPDGTKVTLNSGSKLFYPKKFKGDIREVSIEGEAFFDVKPNPTKPFIIDAGKAQIKVLGTSFNVNAYPKSDKVEVIVKTGKVQVRRHLENVTSSDELILIPGDKGTLQCSNNALQKSKNEDANFMAWKTHNLIFRGTSLSDVVTTLKKVYKTDIAITDNKLENLRLTGQYNDYSIDFIMEVIASTLQLTIEKDKGGKYIIKN